MKKQWKVALLILLFVLAIGLGIWDGLNEERLEETAPAQPAEGDFLESGSETAKNAFLWHLRFKYPELFLWDYFAGNHETEPAGVACPECGAVCDTPYCGACGAPMNSEG